MVAQKAAAIRVKGFLEVSEDMVQILLILKILFTNYVRCAHGLISPITCIFISEVMLIFMVSESVLFLLLTTGT